MATTRVCLLENEAEARLLCAILDDQQIPYTLLRAHDSAFDGLYEAQIEWGRIEAPEEFSASMLQILEDLRQERKSKTPPKAGEEKRPPTITTSIVVVCIFTFFEILIPVLLLANGIDSKWDLGLIVRDLALIIFVIAGIIDIRYLLLRRKWAYYLNITILFLYAAYCILLALLALLAKGAVLAAFLAVACGLLSWLYVEIIRRKDIRYLSVLRKHGKQTCKTKGKA